MHGFSIRESSRFFLLMTLMVCFLSCTKGNSSSSGNVKNSKGNEPFSVSASTMKQKAKDGFVPYANRPPFGQPVETH